MLNMINDTDQTIHRGQNIFRYAMVTEYIQMFIEYNKHFLHSIKYKAVVHIYIHIYMWFEWNSIAYICINLMSDLQIYSR